MLMALCNIWVGNMKFSEIFRIDANDNGSRDIQKRHWTKFCLLRSPSWFGYISALHEGRENNISLEKKFLRSTNQTQTEACDR